MIKQFKEGFFLAHSPRKQSPHDREVMVETLIMLHTQIECRDKGLVPSVCPFIFIQFRTPVHIMTLLTFRVGHPTSFNLTYMMPTGMPRDCFYGDSKSSS